METKIKLLKEIGLDKLGKYQLLLRIKLICFFHTQVKFVNILVKS